MLLKRFSSHYALMPDGKLGKWPVLEITTNGEIVSLVCTPDGFIERPSLQFYGGILIPAFIDIWDGFNDDLNDIKIINRHMAAGTIAIGIFDDENSPGSIKISPPYLIKRNIKENKEFDSKPLSNNKVPVLERLKSISFKNTDIPLVDLLNINTAQKADILEVSNIFGRLLPGLFPGLLVLENIDLTGFLITPQTRVRWLMPPKNLII